MNPRQQFGRAAEEQAARFLQRKGYTIRERNVRLPDGEIDIVAETEGMIVFVEVKAGRDSETFSPVDHFDSRKRQKILRLGKLYLTRFCDERAARFDLISVIDRNGRLEVDHFPDVIQDSPL